MNHSNTTLALVVVTVAVLAVIAALAGLAVGLIARWGGASPAASVQRGGAAFATAFTLMLGVLTIVSMWLL